MVTKFEHFLLENSNNVKYKTINEEDGFYVKAFYENEIIGKIYCEITSCAYWYFEDYFTDDEYYEMFPNDEFINLQNVDVIDDFKNKGISRRLITLALNKCKKMKYNRIYLNACPIGFSGLKLDQLVNYYKSFGFEEILKQDNNVQMLLKIK